MNAKEIGAALALLKGKAIEQVPAAVDEWLDDHPEATTTVEDGAITKAKLTSTLKEEIETNTSDVSTLKNALQSRTDAPLSNDWQNAALNSSNTTEVTCVSSTTRLTTVKKLSLSQNEFVVLNMQAGYKHRVIFFASWGSGNVVIGGGFQTSMGSYDDQTTWHTETKRTLQCPVGAVAYTVCFAKADDSTISTSDSANISLVASWGAELWKEYNFAEYAPKFPRIDLIKLPNYIKNKFDFKHIYITGTGTETTEYGRNSLCYSDIKVNGGRSYTVLFDTNYYGICFAWYTQDGTFISRDNSFPAQTNTKTSIAPSNAYYLKVGLYVQTGTLNDEYVKQHSFVLTNTKYKDSPLSFFESNTPISKYEGKILSILGDSISTFAGYSGQTSADGHLTADGTYTYTGNHCRYPTNYLKYADETYWMKLLYRLGMTIGENDSWAGSCVSWDGTEGSDKGENIYIASPTRIGHLDDNGTPDIILVNAGTNDIGLGVTVGTFNTENPVSYTDEQIAALPVATFADAYRAMLIRLQKAYPLARIIVMLPDYTTSYYNPTNADKYLEIIKEACDFFGVPWVDMRTTGITMYNTGTYLGDGIHPNIAGMELMAQKMINFFEYALN